MDPRNSNVDARHNIGGIACPIDGIKDHAQKWNANTNAADTNVVYRV